MANRGLLTPFSPANKPWGLVRYKNLNKILYLSPSDMSKNITIDIPNGFGVNLPSALLLKLNSSTIIFNISSSSIVIGNNANTTINTLAAGKKAQYICTNITSVAGTWSFTLLN